MIPDKDEMIRLMVEWERRINTQPWGYPPTLAIVGTTDDRNGMVCLSAPVQPADIHLHLPTALAVMAKAWESGAIGAELRRMDSIAADTLGGLITSFEAVGSELPESQRAGRRISELPDHWEARYVVGVDCGGGAYWLERFRGGGDAHWAALTPDSPEVRGPLMESMIRMVKAMVRFAPPDSRNVAKLNELLRAVKK